MRAILLIGCAALALGACGRDDAANDANLTAANDMMMDENAATTNMDADAVTNDTTNNLANNLANNLTNNGADTNVTNSY